AFDDLITLTMWTPDGDERHEPLLASGRCQDQAQCAINRSPSPHREHYPLPYQLVFSRCRCAPSLLQCLPLFCQPCGHCSPPSPGAPEKRAFSWCPLAPRFSPGLDREKTRAIINARLTGRVELF